MFTYSKGLNTQMQMVNIQTLFLNANGLVKGTLFSDANDYLFKWYRFPVANVSSLFKKILFSGSDSYQFKETLLPNPNGYRYKVSLF